MTDREPLRVGPLVLRWGGERAQFVGRYRMLFVNVFNVFQGGESWSYIAGDHIEREFATAIDAAVAARLLIDRFATPGNRSRRRLLARECETRRVECLVMGEAAFAGEDPDGCDMYFARAAKYARWANQLKDSP